MGSCCSRLRAARRNAPRAKSSHRSGTRREQQCIVHRMMQPTPSLSVDVVGEIVRNAVAPVFLLSGIGAFLNVCASRLSRIVDRSREIEPMLLASRGAEHDRWIADLKVLDRRMNLVSS